ncbi:MAG: hypothetical protein CMJ95_07265 [Planctomycetes bacterium]|nr:hypothetical protein [Planctomycetota bacterium]
MSILRTSTVPDGIASQTQIRSGWIDESRDGFLTDGPVPCQQGADEKIRYSWRKAGSEPWQENQSED